MQDGTFERKRRVERESFVYFLYVLLYSCACWSPGRVEDA